MLYHVLRTKCLECTWRPVTSVWRSLLSVGLFPCIVSVLRCHVLDPTQPHTARTAHCIPTTPPDTRLNLPYSQQMRGYWGSSQNFAPVQRSSGKNWQTDFYDFIMERAILGYSFFVCLFVCQPLIIIAWVYYLISRWKMGALYVIHNFAFTIWIYLWIESRVFHFNPLSTVKKETQIYHNGLACWIWNMPTNVRASHLSPELQRPAQEVT